MNNFKAGTEADWLNYCKVSPVAENIAQWFKPIKKLVREHSEYVLDRKKLGKRRIFIDRDSKILLIAHLDTVQKPIIRKYENNILYGAGFDDRIGCMLAYNISKDLGCDLLLTDLEESCKSTAKHHTFKNYNWIAEFDRMGSDVVHYKLTSQAFDDALKKYWTLGIGSFSDISAIETNSCCFNMGVGYKDAHFVESSCDVKMLYEQALKFRKFYAEFKDTAFKIDPEYVKKAYPVLSFIRRTFYPHDYNEFDYDYDADYRKSENYGFNKRGYREKDKPSKIIPFKTEYEFKRLSKILCKCDFCGEDDAVVFGDYLICKNCFIDLMYESGFDYEEVPRCVLCAEPAAESPFNIKICEKCFDVLVQDSSVPFMHNHKPPL